MAGFMFRFCCFWVCLAYLSGDKRMIEAANIMLGIEKPRKKPLEKYEVNERIRTISAETIFDYTDLKRDVPYIDIIK